MALMLPKQRGITREANFSGQPSATWGTSVSSDSVANQFPTAYTELIASTSYDCDWVNVTLHTNSTANTNSRSLVTIYVGADSAEQELIPYLAAGWTVNYGGFGTKRYGFPLAIPAGSRLSARHQSARTSTAVYVMVELLGGGRGDHWTGTRVESVGHATGTSGGTAVTPGGASEGTLTSIGTNTYEWGYVHPQIHANTDTTVVASIISLDLASSNSTANLISGLEDFMFTSGSNEQFVNYDSGRYCTVPASTTLHLRAQSSSSVEAVDCHIHGVH